jgi:hypothetical protein
MNKKYALWMSRATVYVAVSLPSRNEMLTLFATTRFFPMWFLRWRGGSTARLMALARMHNSTVPLTSL